VLLINRDEPENARIGVSSRVALAEVTVRLLELGHERFVYVGRTGKLMLRANDEVSSSSPSPTPASRSRP